MAFFNSSLSLIIPLLLLLGLQLPSLAAIGVDTLISYNENAAAAGLGIVQLMRREKRGDHDMLDFTATFPPDYEIEDENNPATLKPGGAATPETTEHTYYNMTIHSQDAEMFDSVYVDIPNWISQSGAVGQTEHSHLEDAYRKAAGVQLKFEFPFYGHRLQNLTIATGGFLYVGDQTHSWLAATQYIAPLMANFDTMDVQNRSSIQYADDGKRMIVEWQQVTLRDNRPVGPFTFQVHLWRNGNITFVYKEVPIPVSNISDAHHPCKLGISDAYLFNHKVSTQSPSMPQSKRVIHEYHRITIPGDKIGPKTVVMLKALPTCLEANSCEDCIKLQMKPFKCGWCLPKEGGAKTEGGSTDSGSNKPFCSDQLGLHRRRQDWIEGNCQIQEPNQYCKAEEEPPTNSSSNTVATADASTALPIASLVTKVGTTPVPGGGGGAQKMEKPSVDKADESSQQEGSSGIAFITLFLLVGITASIWIGYAYFNPHTRSGQLLIKYRPSKWQIPSSHVRYSASVHM